MYRGFLSVDIETTGLTEDNPDILEIVMIFDDIGAQGIKETLHIYINHEGKDLNWNTDTKAYHEENGYLEKLNQVANAKMEEDAKYLTISQAQDEIRAFIERLLPYNNGFAISMAGKHCGLLTYPVMKNHGLICEGISHKVIDVPSLFFVDFQFVPTLGQLKKKFGFSENTTCREDAIVINKLVNTKIYQALGM